MNISRQVVEDPGSPGTQDVTFAVATVNGVETGRLPSPTSVIAPARESVVRVGHQARHRCAPGERRLHLGRDRGLRGRRKLGDQHR